MALESAKLVQREKRAVLHRVSRIDRQLLALVRQMGACRHDQLHRAISDSPWDGHTQSRCTHLVGERLLKALPRSSRTEPATYFIDRSYLRKLGPIDHLLDISEFRTRVIQSCRLNSYTLRFWINSPELEPALSSYSLVPD